MDANIKYHNRVVKKEEGVYLGWPGTAIEFCGWFEGDITFNVDIKINPYLDSGMIFLLYFFLEVDGVPTKTEAFHGGENKIEIKGLKREYHTIKLIKMNQAQFSTVLVKSITYTGEMDVRPADKPLRIECIGDSITCGEGCMANRAPEFDGDQARTSEIIHAYPTQLGKILDADISHVSCGGWGVECCEWNYGQTIPSIYDYTCWFDDKYEKWDHSSFEPDAIVVALGTNDSGHNVPEDKLDAGIKNFLAHLTEVHPDSFILWVYGMMWNPYDEWIARAISEFGDGRIKYICVDKDNDGGFQHPSLEGHTRFAKTMARIIREKLDI
ncbi:MAG: hypothetical protein E7623_01450 [Ruminococcaceae bacterium]|nr:hypothetical protein [Oscillospiraceae bacterium]